MHMYACICTLNTAKRVNELIKTGMDPRKIKPNQQSSKSAKFVRNPKGLKEVHITSRLYCNLHLIYAHSWGTH